jgi:hypothetical protein
MSNGDDALRMVEAENAEAIAEMQSVEGMSACKAHPALTKGIIRCIRMGELSLHRNGSPAKSVEVGRIKLKGFDAADCVKILLVVAILLWLVADKLWPRQEGGGAALTPATAGVSQ